MSAVAAAELLEREAFLDALRSTLAEVAEERGRLILLNGEAGVGKTALVRRFCADLGGDKRVLWGACDPLFTPGRSVPWRMLLTRRESLSPGSSPAAPARTR